MLLDQLRDLLPRVFLLEQGLDIVFVQLGQPLDERFALNAQANFEVLGEWLNIAAASGYEPAFGRIRDVLEGVGRLKFLMPLYQALGASAPTRALARECLANARHFYHGTALRIVEEIVAAYPG